MICKHFFITIAEVSRAGQAPIFRGTPGIEVGCVNCGQVRKIWADGKVEIVHEGSKPIDEDTLRKEDEQSS